jgi:hypothetical protein
VACHDIVGGQQRFAAGRPEGQRKPCEGPSRNRVLEFSKREPAPSSAPLTESSAFILTSTTRRRAKVAEGFEVGGEIGGGLLAGADFGEPSLFEQPLLMAAFLPLGEVVGLEVFTGVAEALEDIGVGDAVAQHEVDLVAERFGEASDFAVAAVFEGGREVSLGG